MALSLRLSHSLGHSQSLSQSFGETSGDIPVYSLHKIKRQLRSCPMEIAPQLQEMLVRRLVAANAVYREESGNNWNCLTSNNLIEAIAATEAEVLEINELAVTTLQPHSKNVQDKATALLTQYRNESLTVIKRWFEVNYEVLQYSMNGKIPWVVVQRLRRNLGLWIRGQLNVFVQDIEELVLEVAAESKVNTDDAEEAWLALGGKLLNEGND